MSKGELRKGAKDSSRIPLNPPVWFVLLTTDKNKIQEDVYQTTKEGKSKLFREINELENDNIYFKIYGVWNGQWNTNLFDMTIKTLKRRLEEDGVFLWATEPPKKLDIEGVKKAINSGFTLEEIANMESMSCATLKRRLDDAGIILQRGSRIKK